LQILATYDGLPEGRCCNSDLRCYTHAICTTRGAGCGWTHPETNPHF